MRYPRRTPSTNRRWGQVTYCSCSSPFLPRPPRLLDPPLGGLVRAKGLPLLPVPFLVLLRCWRGLGSVVDALAPVLGLVEGEPSAFDVGDGGFGALPVRHAPRVELVVVLLQVLRQVLLRSVVVRPVNLALQGREVDLR